MTDFDPTSLNSFTNQNWSIDTATDQSWIYNTVGMDVTVYTNTDYDLYVTFLGSNEALQKVDEDVAHLTSSTLSTFSNVLLAYDDYSLRIKMSFDDALTVNNQAIALCIAEVDEGFGMMCGTASTGDDTSVSDYRSYWFSDVDGTVAIIKDDDPLDLWDSAYDDHIIDDYYFGITQFFM